MRLYNIYYTCKMAMKDLNRVQIYTNDKMDNGEKETSIINLYEYRRALDRLLHLEFIEKDVQEAIELIANLHGARKRTIIHTNQDRIISTFTVINNKVRSIIDLYMSIKETTDKSGIDIYIPPCKYLKEYIAILKDIDFIISQCPFLQSNEEELQYNGTDVGSDWITLVVVATGVVSGSFYILNNFAELTKKVQEISVRFQKIKQNEEMLKTMRIRNELLEELHEAFANERNEILKEAVVDLKERLGNLNDGEEEGKVLVSIEKYSNLLDRGVKFYSSIESPREIKELLPSSDDSKALTDTIIKYLENKDQSDNEN